MTLKTRFLQLLRVWFEDVSEIEIMWNDLFEKYSESFRKYHNMNHLQELFTYFDRYFDYLKYPNEVAFAIFYHDIVYNVWSKKNELKSAELAQTLLRNTKIDIDSVNRIFNLIMVTKDHTYYGNDDERWMVDFDLGILGQSEERYEKYIEQIREEYASVPTLIYKRGRRKVLRHFLSKERIFTTDVFYDLFESKARVNLQQELERL